MLKYVSKFAMDILPSVVATIIGAYIVNHYIATKPAADGPASAVLSTADPKKSELKANADPGIVLGKIPESGIKARGISEKAMLEKTAGEKAAGEKPAPAEKSIDKGEKEKPEKAADVAAEPRRHQPGLREKTIPKPVPAPVQSATAAVTVPSVVSSTNAAQQEAVISAEERRDANELARAAIERLRAGDAQSRTKDATGLASTSAMPAPAVISPPQVRPLPPPVLVSTPATEMSPPPVADDPHRPPTPPADIPTPSLAPPPLDLRVEAVQPQRQHTNVAEEMLMAAKSVFHSVLPK